MAPAWVVLAYGAVSAALAVLMAPAVWTWIRTRQWTWVSSWILVCGLLVNAVAIVGAVLGARYYNFDNFGNYYVDHGALASQVGILVPWLLLATSAALAGWGLFIKKNALNPVGLVAVGLCCLVALSTSLNGGSIVNGANAPLIAMLVAATVVSPGRDAALGVSAFIVALVIGSGLVAVAHPDIAFVQCEEEKCGPFGVLYTGVETHWNGLALVLALGLPFVYLSLSGWRRTWITVLVAGVALSTGGRTGAVAALAAIAAITVLHPAYGDPPPAKWRRLSVGTGIVVAALISLWVPLTTTDINAFSQRGYLWQIARRYAGEHLIFGNGGQSWMILRDRGLISEYATYSAHNQWLDVYFVAGLAGVALFVALVILMWHRPGMEHRAILMVILAPAVVASVTERPWSFGEFDWMSWLLPATIAAVPGMRRLKRPKRRSLPRRGISLGDKSDPVASR